MVTPAFHCGSAKLTFPNPFPFSCLVISRGAVMVRLGWLLFLGGLLCVLLPKIAPPLNPLAVWFGRQGFLVNLGIILLGVVFVITGRDRTIPH
jgi:hypothetical protein